MVSKVVIALCLLVTIAAAVPAMPPPWLGAWPGAGGVNPAWMPPWLAAAPWMNWGTCATPGPSCLDCNTLLVCTKIGSMQKPCTDPTKPFCNLGDCSATPSDACAAPVVPANAA